ncbi:MAG TPA: BMP family ABC transporter substrate-binding protein [Gemmatimonadaceae bacterium]|nr:BMP family ABC transporter substrate-binding protein [Gemmatimonadaceae bacterium]
MRRLTLTVGLLVALHVALLGIRPKGSSGAPKATVGIVLDIGGRGDKSFNDGAYAGGERASRTLGVGVRYIEPGDGSDREAGLRLLTAEGMKLVIGVGFIFTDDLNALARDFPRTNFAGIDYSPGATPPANLAAIRFREEEGSYLVGAIAALAGGSKKIGFVGGMDIPLIHKFEAGYRAGVAKVCPDCTVIAQYAGATPEAFRDPPRGKDLALSQYRAGANVIYQAAGATGLGVFEAAREADRFVIGTDADQYAEAPGHVLTSMVKHVDVATFDIIQHFSGGVHEFGLADGGIGYVYDQRNRPLIPDAVHAKVDSLAADIIAGRIHVPTR